MLSRVHWLLWELSPSFKGYYRLLYDYKYHKYCFYRNYCNNRGNRLKEIFIVIRTSKRCFRVMYYNDYRNIFAYSTFKSSKKCAEWMMNIGYPSYKV